MMTSAFSQNRHILALLNIPIWAKKTHASTPMPVTGAYFDKFHQKKHQYLLNTPIPVEQPSNDEPPPTFEIDVNESDDVGDGYGYGIDEHQTFDTSIFDTNDVSVPPINNATPQTDVPTTTSVSSIQYHLKGIRFGRWVLVMDMKYVDTNVHSIWLSLSDALQRQAAHLAMPYRMHEVQYPLVQDEYVEHQKFAPANQVCLGFILGLAMPDLTNVQIGLLTPLTDGLFIDNAYTLTDIRLLAMHTEQKKSFWTLINQE